jgi:hypothetical protein
MEAPVMRLLFRSVLFLLRSVLTLSALMLANLVRLLKPCILAVFRFLINLITGSISATVHGPRQYSRWLASKWTRQLLDRGSSRDYLDQIYGLCQFLAVSKIFMGWVVAAFLMVAILRVVFGFLI